MARLAATMIATAAAQAPMSDDDLNAAFSMISTLLWIGLDVLERQQAHGTVRVPALSSETI
jgi:hypothetical protein